MLIKNDLVNIVESSSGLIQLHKTSLAKGDCIIIKTINSIYEIKVLENDQYLVIGGWFKKNNINQFKTSIHGCTWGGSIIKTDIVAACGLHLEFGNYLLTSKIVKFFHMPDFVLN